MHKRLARVAIVCVGALIASCDNGAQVKQLETPRGTIQYKEVTTRPSTGFNDTLRELTSEQRAKIGADLTKVEPFIGRHVPDEQRSPDLLENLDLAFAHWLKSSDPNKESAQYVIDVVGSGLGNYSIERLNVKWMVATDERGTELALVGDDPPTRAYPFASIRYRIEDRKIDFVSSLYEALKNYRERR